MAVQPGLGFADINEEEKKKKKPADTSKIIPTISLEGQKLFQTEGQAKPAPSIPPATTPAKPFVPTLEVKEEVVGTPTETPTEEKVALGETFSPETTTETTTETGPTSKDIATSIAELKKQNMLRQRRQAFDLARGALQRQLGELPGQFREAKTGVLTRDVMEAEAARKRAAIGATGSGSLAQSDIARSIATGGQLGALTQQELQAKESIKNRMSDLEIAFANDVATIENEAEMAQLQQQLEEITAKETAALKQAEIKDERDFQLYLRELDRLDDREKLQLQAELEREQTLLDSEIQRARDNRQFALEKQLIDRRAANDIKLEGVRSANTQAEIALRGEQERETIRTREELEPTAEETTGPRYSTKDLKTAVENRVSGIVSAKYDLPEDIKQARIESVIEIARSTIDTEEQLNELIISVGLTPEEVDAYLGE